MKAFILIGPPGSGKSVQAGEIVLRENANIVNGDSIREGLYGDASIQGNWVDIHNKIEEYVAECAGLGVPVILDGTHCKRTYRAEAITLLQSYGYDKIDAIVMGTDLDTCLIRNAKRQRNVPRHIIVRMYGDLQHSLKGIESEGFDSVTYIR
jgi:predicted kinase